MNAQGNALRQAAVNAMKAGQIDQAIQSLQQAAGLDPECYDTYAYLGAAYAQQKNFDSSRRAFGRAVQIQPQSARARFNLGQAHHMAGDVEASRVCFEAALDLDPSYVAAKDALNKLPPKVINIAQLATPGGSMHLPGAHTSGYGEDAVAPTKGLTPSEIAQLASPQGHLHMMGAQATEDDPPPPRRSPRSTP